MTMQLRYATVPMPSTTEFARHLNVWLLELCAKIKAGWGLLTPPNWAWEGADVATTTFLTSSTSSMRLSARVSARLTYRSESTISKT